MLQYLQPADEVFLDVMEEALRWMIEDLRENSQDPEAYRDLAPRAAQFLEPKVTIETLEHLRACSEAPELYHLKAAHRLLLTDVLRRYCDLFNEEPFEGSMSEVHEKYGLRHLDAERLLAAFIDSPGTRKAGELTNGSERLRGKRLQLQDLALQPVTGGAQEPNIVSATVSPWYRAGAESYPVVTAMA